MRTFNNIIYHIKEVYKYRFVLYNLVITDLKIRYRRSVLGFLWTLLHPLMTMTITSIVFSYIMRFELKEFVIFLFSGLLPFNFCGISMNFAASSIINAEGFIKKIYIPRIIFPLTTVFSNFINFILSMTCLFIMAMFIGAKVTYALTILPLSLVIMILFAIGGALITSTTSVYYRDLIHIYDVIIQTMFYATPIIYPLSFMPKKFHWLFKLNPFYYIVEIFRKPIYGNIFPDIKTFCLACFVSLISIAIGLIVFEKLDKKIVFRL